MLHVRDIASEETNAQAQDVRTVLSRLGVNIEERRILEVWNKSDLLPADRLPDLVHDARRADPPAVLVSAVTGQGCEALLATVANLVDEAPPVDIYAPAGEGAAIAWLYRNGRVLERVEGKDGSVRLAVSLSPQAMGQLEQMYPGVEIRGH